MTAFDVRARMEELGVAQMRLLLSNGGWPPGLQNDAIQWLAEKDRETVRLQQATESEQMAIARESNLIAREAAASAARSAEAARTNNIIATFALIAAIIAIAISVFSIFVRK